MKTYYLVAEKSLVSDSYQVHVTDNPRGMEILKSFEAQNFVEAQRRYTFMVHGLDKAAWCGIDPEGKAFHGES